MRGYLIPSIFAALGVVVLYRASDAPPNELDQRSLGATAAAPISLQEPLARERSRPALPWAAQLRYSAEGPSPVHLAEVPVAEFDANNKLSRGWGQDGTPKRMRGPIPREEMDRLREAARLLPPNPNVQRLDGSGITPLALAPGVSFDSLDYNDCCGGGGNVPPDPEFAVGPNHIIAVVNVAFEIYDKSGTRLAGPTTFASFFAGSGCPSQVFDPNVLYDESADRFILGIDGDGTDYCVAATTGADPLGAWHRYHFATDFAGAFFDYPHAGVGRSAIYMGSNQFDGSLPGGFESRVFAFDKAALYSGTALTVVSHSLGASNSTPQPMNLHGFAQGTWPSSGPHFVMTEKFDGARHSVWSWQDPFGADLLTETGVLNLNTATGVTAGFPVDVPQQGSTARLQANDWRGLDTEYRNGRIWMTNTLSCNPGSGTVDCIRWAEIDPSVPAVIDAGVFASNGEYRFFPDLAVNQCGDMAVGYTKSSASMFPSVFVTGREATDPAGTLQPEVQLKAGELFYTGFDASPHRWGDYTGMTIDPDGQRFWYLGEYSKNTGTIDGRWGNFIGAFSYPGCGGGPDDCDIDGDGDADRADAVAFFRGCRGGSASWDCDRDGSGGFDIADLIDFVLSCR
ncbi:MULTISPECIES: hypothetical protein [unclassified Thiocapsa]|uniref:hypothetical protein n=1 Tax=unclassified Thiocapsa TaxID=2641286 RepID=UPI0035B29E3F